MKRFKKVWRLWSKALGAKEGSNDKEANMVAFFRTLITLQVLTTNCFIIANAIVHWPK